MAKKKQTSTVVRLIAHGRRFVFGVCDLAASIIVSVRIYITLYIFIAEAEKFAVQFYLDFYQQ